MKYYGGLKVDQAKRFKEIEVENTWLEKQVAELSVREAMLKEVVLSIYAKRIWFCHLFPLRLAIID